MSNNIGPQRAAPSSLAKIRAELKQMTPSNERLLELAKRFPPPPEWYEGEEEDLFAADQLAEEKVKP